MKTNLLMILINLYQFKSKNKQSSYDTSPPYIEGISNFYNSTNSDPPNINFNVFIINLEFTQK